MNNTDITYLTKEQSASIKGFLILLIILGHNTILMGNAPGLEQNATYRFLYTFHVFGFLFLPFLYNIPRNSLARIKKNFVHLYKPYTVAFILLAMTATLVGNCNWGGVIFAYLLGSGPLLEQYAGASFLWFLPAMFLLLILRDSLLHTRAALAVVASISIAFVFAYCIVGIIPWEYNRYSLFGAFEVMRIFGFAVIIRLLAKYTDNFAVQAISTILAIICSVLFIAVIDGLEYQSHKIVKNSFAFIVMPCVMFWGVVCCAKLLSKVKWVTLIFSWLGKYSLEIYIIHIFIYNAIYMACRSLAIDINIAIGVATYLLTIAITLAIICMSKHTKAYHFIFK